MAWKSARLSLVVILMISLLTSCTSNKESWEKAYPLVFAPGPKQVKCEVKDSSEWAGIIYFNVVNVSGNPIDGSQLTFRLYDSTSKELASSTSVEYFDRTKPPYDEYSFSTVQFSPTKIENPTNYSVFLNGEEIYTDSLLLMGSGNSMGVDLEINKGFCNMNLDFLEEGNKIEKDSREAWKKFISQLNNQ